MTTQPNNLSSGSANWRKTLRQNNTRTYFVIALFFLIYTGIGVVIDLYLHHAYYPIATTIMLLIAAVSLYVSYLLHDTLMLLGTDHREITPDTAKTLQEKQLYNVVDEMRIAAGLHYMPRVYIIDADYMNAFASGYSEKSALLAITRGLMEKLNRDELQAVMAHELSHVQHLDIKLTLTASLLANMTIIVLDIFFRGALYSRSDEERPRNGLLIIIIVLRFLLPVINILLLLYLSRTRELMADAGAVALTRDNQPLASALIKINDDYANHQDKYTALLQNTPHENVRREAYLFDPAEAGIASLTSVSDLFSTHPSLAVRLKALGIERK